jgi:hypothetical protein
LNTHVFHWPDHIKNVFEIAQKIILSKRDSIEDELKSRTAKFEEKLNKYRGIYSKIILF